MPPKVTAIARAVAVVAAGSLLWALPTVTGDADAASHQEIQRARHTRVYIQGDSLTVGSSSALRRTLGRKVANVSVDAAIGRFTATGLARIRHDRRARKSRVWVIALGTNDAPRAHVMKRAVRKSLRLAGPRRHVIWLTVQRPGPYGRVNKMMRRLDRSSQRLHLVDWARLMKRRSGLLVNDRVHATAKGYRTRARLISQQALTLAQQP
ncbi:MAG: hypothetical protein Q8P38_11730 [Candidatus Nanopelagicales bacterium]|nr:hypothetical protein [Candidatus Nanopelagicales bacterium]